MGDHSTKRQRVQPPPPEQLPGADTSSPTAADNNKRKYNGPCCGGLKLADAVQINMAKRIGACWVSDEKGHLVATKCGKCKKIVVPTFEQRQRMERFKLKSIYDEVQLRDAEASTGFSPEELLAICKA